MSSKTKADIDIDDIKDAVDAIINKKVLGWGENLTIKYMDLTRMLWNYGLIVYSCLEKKF